MESSPAKIQDLVQFIALQIQIDCVKMLAVSENYRGAVLVMKLDYFKALELMELYAVLTKKGDTTAILRRISESYVTAAQADLAEEAKTEEEGLLCSKSAMDLSSYALSIERSGTPRLGSSLSL